MDGDEPTPGVPELSPELRAAITALLIERQALLTGPLADTREGQARLAALDVQLDALLEQMLHAHPPDATLEDQAPPPGEFERFLDRASPENGTG